MPWAWLKDRPSQHFLIADPSQPVLPPATPSLVTSRDHDARLAQKTCDWRPWPWKRSWMASPLSRWVTPWVTAWVTAWVTPWVTAWGILESLVFRCRPQFFPLDLWNFVKKPWWLQIGRPSRPPLGPKEPSNSLVENSLTNWIKPRVGKTT